MRFIDKTEIYVKAGKGGDGIVAFKSARNKPKLGPDGGYGGHGGNVYMVADRRLNTLSTLRYKHKYSANDGARGGANNRTGACGADLEVSVPVGTIVKKQKTSTKLELLRDGQRILLAKGGQRGRGNLSFLSSTNRAPKHCTPGQAGEEFWLSLELKVLADVGFAGMPNAGKSTLLSVLSNAKPKVADYPFTTLSPVLGMVEIPEIDSYFTIADIPGLIAGASQGKGLGIAFLRHLERARTVAYVIDGASDGVDTIRENFYILRNELWNYNSDFRDKETLVIVNKIDLLDTERKQEIIALLKAEGLDFSLCSGATGEGVKELAYRLSRSVSNPPSLQEWTDG